MSKRKKPIHLPTDREISLMLSRIAHPREQLIVVLAVKLGLRASEIANLRLSDIDWESKTITFYGKGTKLAVLPLTDEVLGYLERALKLRPTSLEYDFVIWNTHNPRKKGVSRFNIYYLIRKHGEAAGIRLWTHLLRHKFCTDIIRKADIYKAKEAMRHSRLETTTRYAHLAEAEEQRPNFELLDSRHWLLRFLSKFKPTVPSFLLEKPVPAFTGETIGRKKEQEKLNENIRVEIPTILVGERGAGSSHLLRQIKGNGIYRLDSIRPAREKLIELCQQMKAGGVLSDIPKSRSVSAILKALIEAVKDRHFTLVIDSLSDITKEGILLLRKIKGHFTIVSSIESKQRNKLKDIFFGSHDVVSINPLSSEDAYRLADAASIELPTTPEGREIFLKRVVSESKGNPKAMIEILEKEKRRGKIVDASTEISHDALQEPLPATPFLSTFLILAIVARYGASSIGMPDWKIILIVAIAVVAVLLLIDRVLKQDK